MQFDLSTVVALILFLLTGDSLALDCYKDGTTWAELGDDAAIAQAFNSLCNKMSGTYKLHDNIVNCENLNGHHIQAAIWPLEGNTHDYNLVDLSLAGCVDYTNQTKSRFPDHGGEVADLETDPDAGEGAWIKSQVKADPEDGTKHC